MAVTTLSTKKCTSLSSEDIIHIENTNNIWHCSICMDDLFPFSQLNSTTLNNVMNPRVSTNRRTPVSTPIRAVSIPKSQCFACKNPVPRNHYKNKNIIYNNELIKLCKICAHDQSKLKHDNIEYLYCTICTKTVNYESIFCSLCQHWIHPDCAKLKRKDISTIGDSSYGDWFCPPCSQSIFPYIESEEKLKTIESTEFITYNDCGTCFKKVQGDSICCGICKHWVHRKCIDKFPKNRKLKTETFENVNNFYKDRDWFCFECSRPIFPVLGNGWMISSDGIIF